MSSAQKGFLAALTWNGHPHPLPPHYSLRSFIFLRSTYHFLTLDYTATCLFGYCLLLEWKLPRDFFCSLLYVQPPQNTVWHMVDTQ